MPTISASKKRKFGDTLAPSPYYGVKAGHQPGVYTDWDECLKTITGFSGAVCRCPSRPRLVASV